MVAALNRSSAWFIRLYLVQQAGRWTELEFSPVSLCQDLTPQGSAVETAVWFVLCKICGLPMKPNPRLSRLWNPLDWNLSCPHHSYQRTGLLKKYLFFWDSLHLLHLPLDFFILICDNWQLWSQIHPVNSCRVIPQVSVALRNVHPSCFGKSWAQLFSL